MKPHKITELFAWIVEHPNGEEGVPAINGGGGLVLPLIGSDRERIESLREAAQLLAGVGAIVTLRKFSSMETLESLPQTGSRA